MADAALEFVLNTLKELVEQKSKLIGGLGGNIENLQRDLRIFKAFLRDTVSMPKKKDVTTERIKEIHDVIYQLEDIIELFVNATERRNMSWWEKLRRKANSPSDLLSIAEKVEEIKDRVEKCRKELSIISVTEVQPEKDELQWPLGEKDVVGFEDVTNELIDRLLKETDCFDVISIIGMVGLGKTTVAWKIFNDPRIIYQFPLRIWLPVSQEFTDKEIFTKILKQAGTTTDDISGKSGHELGELVRSHLERRCFLIVMDDVWEPAHWDRLRAALPKHNNKGKVLITSRKVGVGTYASSPRLHLDLRELDFKESLELFQLEALRKQDWPSDELKRLGQEIAKNCNGLPLAIVIIGGILATKFSPRNLTAMTREWKEVAPRVSSYLNENDPEKRMRKLISLSYNNLPYHLRACFLYLGMFREDYEIRVSKLIRMWIGEGFVHHKYQIPEVTAQKYLEDLIHRNLVKSQKFKNDGTVKTCRIHDTIRDFCCNEGADENFLQEITSNDDGQFVPSDSDIATYRRLFIHSNCSAFISSKPFVPRVRTFVCFHNNKDDLSAGDGANIIRAFQLVRVLDVFDFKFTKIDSDLYKLVGMRYIAMSSNLSILPSKFDKFGNIQTLIVHTTFNTLEVKADIWKMKRLRHFKTNASAILPKSSVSKEHRSKELQTLGSISVESCTEELTSRGCNVKKLGIRGKLALLFDSRNRGFNSLKDMEKLGKLKLINDVYPQRARTGALDCLPEHDRFPSLLTSLTLCATYLKWVHMSTLGNLKELKVLKLKDNAFIGDTWDSVDGGFQSLEILHIEDTDLAEWNASPGHYRNLRGVVLKNCEKLHQIPIELAGISTLQMIDLNTCISAAESAKKIEGVKKGAGDSDFLLSIYPPCD